MKDELEICVFCSRKYNGWCVRCCVRKINGKWEMFEWLGNRSPRRGWRPVPDGCLLVMARNRRK